jgi:acetylornithine/succinyldiaminopimelate/putrescine aminotransferase
LTEELIQMAAISHKELFLRHVAQTSQAPIGIEMVKAEGVYLYGADGQQYIDLIAGFSVANIGHSHPAVVKAVQTQAAEYMHLIVYGEFIQQPQVAYAKLLTEHLPASLNCVYFTNSGTEATEGAMKLAKRVTGRTRIISFNNSYHGSTQGALSVMGGEYWRNAFRPLLPDVLHLNYGSVEALEAIDHTVACVIMETVQAEAGVKAPDAAWIQAVRKKCDEHCVLLILDEIQSGFGRTGKLWAFEHFGIVPDILLLGKALGGGMPLGAFIADQRLLSTLTYDPVLGHITTFGGHPVSCAAGKAAFEVLLASDWMATAPNLVSELGEALLQHPLVQRVHLFSAWMAVEFADDATAQSIIHRAVKHGLITDWFLFAPNCMRIAPPLCITSEEIQTITKKLLEVLNA